jgi:hypothetical protein
MESLKIKATGFEKGMLLANSFISNSVEQSKIDLHDRVNMDDHEMRDEEMYIDYMSYQYDLEKDVQKDLWREKKEQNNE